VTSIAERCSGHVIRGVPIRFYNHVHTLSTRKAAGGRVREASAPPLVSRILKSRSKRLKNLRRRGAVINRERDYHPIVVSAKGANHGTNKTTPSKGSLKRRFAKHECLRSQLAALDRHNLRWINEKRTG